MEKWFPLDNAGIFYPSIISDRITTVFRLSVTLDHRIKVKQLQIALDKTIRANPLLQVNLRPGFFWYFFEENKRRLLITKDTKYPCRKIPIKRRGVHPFQVKAFYNKISLEISHSLTDGTGALFYLQQLVIRYFRELGYKVPLPKRPGHEAEAEDSYKRYFKPKLPPPRKSDNAFHFLWKKQPKDIYNITTGYLPLEKIKDVCKSYNVSITEYLLTVLGWSIQEVFLSLPINQQKKHSKPFRLMVPINLRKLFPSKTLRNFFLSIEPSFDPELGVFTFEEILKIIHHFLRVEVNDKYISRQISRNIRGQMESKLIPLFIKNIALKSLYKKYGESKYTTSISNMGKLSFPEELEPMVKKVEFIPPPSSICKIKLGVISFNGTLSITFGSVVKESELEMIFFKKLREHGIVADIESNRS